jgi:acyl-Coa thioesterase superfamily protein/acyl-CoA thioesterase superfamily protein
MADLIRLARPRARGIADPSTEGPPTALLAHACIRLDPKPEFRLARITVEFLAPVPRSRLRVAAQITRTGRRARLIEAVLSVGGSAVALARAWEIARDHVSGLRPDASLDMSPQREIPPPQEQRYFPRLSTWGYGEAIEWRFAEGGYDQQGPADVWTRVRIPLIAGHPIAGLDRALIVADSANGVSAILPHDLYAFIPPTVTVTLHRHPSGEWINLRAQTALASDGIGSSYALLSDRQRELGTVTQPLLVRHRRPGDPVGTRR